MKIVHDQGATKEILLYKWVLQAKMFGLRKFAAKRRKFLRVFFLIFLRTNKRTPPFSRDLERLISAPPLIRKKPEINKRTPPNSEIWAR